MRAEEINWGLIAVAYSSSLIHAAQGLPPQVREAKLPYTCGQALCAVRTMAHSCRSATLACSASCAFVHPSSLIPYYAPIPEYCFKPLRQSQRFRAIKAIVQPIMIRILLPKSTGSPIKIMAGKCIM